MRKIPSRAFAVLGLCIVAVAFPGCRSEPNTGLEQTEKSAAPMPMFGAALPEPNAECIITCAGPDGPCELSVPCCPPSQWSDAAPAPIAAEDVTAAADGTCLGAEDLDSAAPIYYANCAWDSNASPPEQCGVSKQGAAICEGNAAGRAYWTSTCQQHADCPADMKCRFPWGIAEVPVGSANFGMCERECAADADCLRCDLGCFDGICGPKGM